MLVPFRAGKLSTDLPNLLCAAQKRPQSTATWVVRALDTDSAKSWIPLLSARAFSVESAVRRCGGGTK